MPNACSGKSRRPAWWGSAAIRKFRHEGRYRPRVLPGRERLGKTVAELDARVKKQFDTINWVGKHEGALHSKRDLVGHRDHGLGGNQECRSRRNRRHRQRSRRSRSGNINRGILIWDQRDNCRPHLDARRLRQWHVLGRRSYRNDTSSTGPSKAVDERTLPMRNRGEEGYRAQAEAPRGVSGP